MGSCASVHKGTASAVKVQFSIESKDGKVLAPSPVKERADMVNGGDRTAVDVAVAPKLQLSPARFVHAGSKDEAFFDSQPWLESDCEDDFFSVNGDFTPSRGNTPVHHSFSSGNPRSINNARSTEQQQSTVGPTSPPDKKKRLSELFNESPDKETASLPNSSHQNGPHEPTGLARRPKSSSGTPYFFSRPNSRTSSERTPSNFGGPTEKEDDKAQCCLPKLISSRSFSERRKKATSPVGKIG
ncbi:Unknown protein [Striga hermonthica]|uniref:Uncharacterized protein n=1 Tax=Striga hermonthica TaxID=68872 RepID=A0A9N7REP7_STRHE|nr:Unknown protein [Striga hermonthica]